MVNLPDIMIVGLTGMSGAGKSTVSQVFRDNLVNVVNCDFVAFYAARKKAFLQEIKERFPDNILDESGQLDRRRTHSVIFGDNEKRELYNRILFPYIVYDIMNELRRYESPVLLDAPTLFESGLDMICTEIIAVIADRELCEARITERDGITRESARARLSSQHGADFFRERCGCVLENNGTPEELAEKTKKLIETLKVNV